jgi:hypothetical protein
VLKKLVLGFLIGALLSACHFNKEPDIKKTIEKVKQNKVYTNTYASDYLYAYRIIDNENIKVMYYSSKINYGSVIYSLLQFLQTVHSNSIYSEAELIALVHEFDKYSTTPEYSVIQCYFQSTEDYKYIFNPEFITYKREFCFSISYVNDNNKTVKGYFIYYPEHEIFKYYKEKPDEDFISNNLELSDKEKQLIFLYHLYENLFMIYANNGKIDINRNILDLVNIEDTNYTNIITPLIDKNKTYQDLVNNLYLDLNNSNYDSNINNAIIANCIFAKIIRECI